MNRFSGKVVVVTGAASGFGEAIARRFAAEGTSVRLSDIDVERLAAELGSGERPVDCAPADLSQEDDVPKLIETDRTTFGALDVLVNNAGYSHGAVLTSSRRLALELARHNIRVNAVNPVAAATGFMKGAIGVEELSADQRAALVSTIPRGRLAEPRDVAAAVAFLASDEADMITGTSIDVDGGRSI
jgi:NAD(P)-dependent dehydrogenase (short-subunit alcohol dehydrogenase family)